MEPIYAILYKWQSFWLFLVNFPIINLWFRWVLRIGGKKRGGIRWNDMVCRILPHGVVVDNRDNSYRLQCYTHDKIVKRLYFAFLPVWKSLHWLDMNVFAPIDLWGIELGLNFGFDTLIVRPGTGGSGSTMDGALQCANKAFTPRTWAQLLLGDTSNCTQSADLTSNAGYGARIAADPSGNTWTSMNRSAFTFDTATTLLRSNVTAATLGLNVSSWSNSLSLADTNYYVGLLDYPGPPYQEAAGAIGTVDWQNFSTPDFVNGPYWTTSDAIGSITTKTISTALIQRTDGFFTKLGGQFRNQATQIEPTWVANGVAAMSVSFADNTGTSLDPVLTVTYWPAISIAVSSGNNQTGYLTCALSLPFTVIVKDGQPIPQTVDGVTVTFSIHSTPSGATGQSISVSSADTASGLASTTLTLGDTVGTYTVWAANGTLTGSPVAFTGQTPTSDFTAVSLSDPIECTTAADPHGYITGQEINISGAYIKDSGGKPANAHPIDGNWVIYVTATNKMQLVGSKHSGAWIGGGTISATKPVYR